MKKTVVSLGITILLITVGCRQGQQVVPAETLSQQFRTLFDQQSAAYPMLAENAYLSIADFEDAGQLDDFALSQAGAAPKGKSELFYSGSPTATGTGALGVYFDATGDYTLTFDMPIRRWAPFNLLLCALHVSDPQVDCLIEFTDGGGQSTRKRYRLENGWNKLQIDLHALDRTINLDDVMRVRFTFFQAGETRVYLDDMILVDYHKNLLGELDGRPGTLFAVQDGKRIRVGANKRFELVFASGKMIAWYDLDTDENRMNNLLSADAPGLEIFPMAEGKEQLAASQPADAPVTVHTSAAVWKDQEIQVKTETWLDQFSMKAGPDRQVLYRIRPDGLILLEMSVRNPADRLGIGFAVAGDQGFDPVIGRVHNPLGEDGARVEYALFRRMGKKAGADLLMAVQPWMEPTQTVQCTIEQQKDTCGLRALFSGDASVGENDVFGMMQVWPAKIDHLGNAEKYVREFMEVRKTRLDSNADEKTPADWTPLWQVDEK